VEEEREDGLPMAAHGASSDCGSGADGGGAVVAMAGGAPLFFSAVFFFLFLSFSLPLFSLFCSVLLFSFHFCSLPFYSAPLSLRLPCIYRKTGERHGWGSHYATALQLPEEACLLRFSNTWEATGQLSKIRSLVGVFLN